MNNRKNQLKAINRLLDIMDDLRAQCPWDKKQTFESLKNLTIEEVYELGDAIIAKDFNEIKKELGDVLLHIFFYAKIASETNNFDIADVANSISDKLIFRHPHIYGNVTVENEEDVKANWEKLKIKEGNTSILQGVPNSLPAMVKASRIQEKVASVGFDWDEPEQVWLKVREELNEFNDAKTANQIEEMESEFGDLMFSMINYARHLGINPENALEKTNLKFKNRFQYLEQETNQKGIQLHDMTLEEMDVFWEASKKLYK